MKNQYFWLLSFQKKIFLAFVNTATVSYRKWKGSLDFSRGLSYFAKSSSWLGLVFRAHNYPTQPPKFKCNLIQRLGSSRLLLGFQAGKETKATRLSQLSVGSRRLKETCHGLANVEESANKRP